MESEAMLKQRRSERTTAGMGSYSTTIQNDVGLHWARLAKEARDSIEVTELKKGDKYDVKAVLKNRNGVRIGKGKYSSGNNQHAEIGAFASCRPRQRMSLSVTPPPCKRCAVVVRLYMLEYDMTLKAPEVGFANTYSGGYHITKEIEDMIIQNLIAKGVISKEQGKHYRADIISDFVKGSWIIWV